ncbi:PadR family transcriptional regulator [Thermococcus gammatolerans]|uniref:Transcription regulator, PadR-like family n=1 Tax=Thermococcus gammatolerans (strain DSM 15229 / JCM 11827 / EJ3) TaxID=593117 RepID=C5A6B5_THEGJ|nr:PadR family transcriptional regulator [Thermococcus gammatolerans]ACS33777.1 Transcription regulator, PadR-like family [Thermococcus gammatolerans EJ3]
MEKPSYRGHLKILILKMLSEKPLHGYGIMRELEERYGLPQPSPGTIYPILASLRRSGLIEVIGEGKREKRLYRATEKGRKYIEENSRELEEVLRTVEKFREFSRLGGVEVGKVLKEAFSSLDGLSEEQKEELAREFKDFVRRVRAILSGIRTR